MNDKDAKNLERFLIKIIGREDKQLGPLTNLTDGGDGAIGRLRTEEERKRTGRSIRKLLTNKNI